MYSSFETHLKFYDRIKIHILVAKHHSVSAVFIGYILNNNGNSGTKYYKNIETFKLC